MMKKLNWQNVLEQAIGTILATPVIGGLSLLGKVLLDMASEEGLPPLLWIILSVLAMVILLALPPSRRFFGLTGRMLLQIISRALRWGLGNWQLVLGVGILLAVAVGVFALTRMIWSIVLLFCLVVGTILLARCRSEARYQKIMVKLPSQLISNADNLLERYSDPPLGGQLFNGVPFLLDREYFEVCTGGERSTEFKLLPPVGPVDSVHLLINAGNAWKGYQGLDLEGTVIGRVRLCFDDETWQELKVIVGRNVREWSPGNFPGKLVDTITDPLSQVAWRGANIKGREAVIDQLRIPIRRRHRKKKLKNIVIFRDIQQGTLQDILCLAIFAITLECCLETPLSCTYPLSELSAQAYDSISAISLPGKKLVIASARYGAEEKYVDVTQVLRSLVSGNKLNLSVVSNDALQVDDPIEGVVKTLTVMYVYDGETVTRDFIEHKPMSLP